MNNYQVGQLYFREIEMAKIRITHIANRTGSGRRLTFVDYEVTDGCITGNHTFIIGDQFDKDNKLTT
jgi:hypothetical protein